MQGALSAEALVRPRINVQRNPHRLSQLERLSSAIPASSHEACPGCTYIESWRRCEGFSRHSHRHDDYPSECPAEDPAAPRDTLGQQYHIHFAHTCRHCESASHPLQGGIFDCQLEASLGPQSVQGEQYLKFFQRSICAQAKVSLSFALSSPSRWSTS